MSIEVQKQIKDNSSDVRGYFDDLYKWTAQKKKEETRRERASPDGSLPKQFVPPPRGSVEPEEKPKKQKQKDNNDEVKNDPTKKRDVTPMPKYYSSWDQYNVDSELERLDEEARLDDLDRKEEAEKLYDEKMDRLRTSNAKPGMKIRIRRAQRRASPVDNATSKKEEANQYFQAGRFKDAMVAYTVALDYLESYEPLEEGQEAKTPDDDGVGDISEALLLKANLYANRAAACMKLESYLDVVDDCSDALRCSPGHLKASFRRGTANSKLKRWGRAAKDLEVVCAADPSDKKAATELRYVKRMLAEDAKELRRHAQRIMCDPTREPKMPTRRLVVSAGQGKSPVDADQCEAAIGSAAPAPIPAEKAPSAKVAQEAEDVVDTAKSAALLEAALAEKRAAKPKYIPRSVQLQKGPSKASKSQAPQATMNFYAFETAWERPRCSVADRIKLLRKVGPEALPGVLRESLSSELVASITATLHAHLQAEGEQESAWTFRVITSLTQAQRFDVSLRCLSEEERCTCEAVIAALEGHGCDPAGVDKLRTAFARPAAITLDDCD
eukprot:gnl/MRDRNA2_/MRDRNA2_126993_c0_seq1.p1 gnl/MRDRNA2_/MRDRNA2_126993_c0~~gnl/MRDRNA2_/MRDRNA2_126993_c0_seq1.p1  ORF type:complete len:555 (+),score=149.36 gnl/MRDRNA2_/MRDRNA2_126993_c0_seq1:95-1759(+)